MQHLFYCCHKATWSNPRHLVLGPYALHVQGLCQLVQAAMEIAAELHQVLNVIDGREVDLHQPGRRYDAWQPVIDHVAHVLYFALSSSK